MPMRFSKTATRIRGFAVGGPAVDIQAKGVDTKLVAHLAQHREDAMRAFRRTLGLVVVLIAATAWFAITGTAVANIAWTVALAATTAAGARWLFERNERIKQYEQVITLGSIFYQEPEVLSELLRPEVLRVYLRNLLRTVLRDGDLGQSMWDQAIDPLVDALASRSYRTDFRYEIELSDLAGEVAIQAQGSEELTFTPEDHRRLRTRLRFKRKFSEVPNKLWVGLMFDLSGGSEWFRASQFALREYAPLDSEQVARLRPLFRERDVFATEPSRLRKAVTALGRRIDTSGQSESMNLIEQLCEASIVLDGDALTPDEVRLDSRGLGIGFPVPGNLRKRLKGAETTEVDARLGFPLPRVVSNFPVLFTELTRGAQVRFDYQGAAVTDVHSEMFFSLNQPFATDRRRVSERAIEIATTKDNWVFAGDGVAFTWGTGGDTAAGRYSP